MLYLLLSFNLLSCTVNMRNISLTIPSLLKIQFQFKGCWFRTNSPPPPISALSPPITVTGQWPVGPLAGPCCIELHRAPGQGNHVDTNTITHLRLPAIITCIWCYRREEEACISLVNFIVSVHCTLGWVNFSELEITVCGSYKM